LNPSELHLTLADALRGPLLHRIGGEQVPGKQEVLQLGHHGKDPDQLLPGVDGATALHQRTAQPGASQGTMMKEE